MSTAAVHYRAHLGHRASLRGARAFTMIEMVTSCAILSLLMLALGYGLKLALVSTGIGAANAAASSEAVDVVERVTDDLNEAINFTEKGPESVTLTVPSRGPDDPAATTRPSPDEIRYKWWPAGGTIDLGTGGGGLIGGLLGLLGGPDPSPDGTQFIPQYVLTRQVNGGPMSVLARDVRQFKLDYLYRSMSPPAAAAEDRLLWQHEPSIPEGTAAEALITDAVWTGETFRAPAAAVPAGSSYEITRMALYLRADAALDGLIRVKVCTADAGTNTPNFNAVLDEAFVPEVSLTGSMGWVEVKFTKLKNLDRTLKYSVLLEGDRAAANHGAVGYYHYLIAPILTPLPPNTYWVQTQNSGGAWSVQSLRSLRYRVFGTTTSL